MPPRRKNHFHRYSRGFPNAASSALHTCLNLRSCFKSLQKNRWRSAARMLTVSEPSSFVLSVSKLSFFHSHDGRKARLTEDTMKAGSTVLLGLSDEQSHHLIAHIVHLTSFPLKSDLLKLSGGIAGKPIRRPYQRPGRRHRHHPSGRSPPKPPLSERERGHSPAWLLLTYSTHCYGWAGRGLLQGFPQNNS